MYSMSICRNMRHRGSHSLRPESDWKKMNVAPARWCPLFVSSRRRFLDSGGEYSFVQLFKLPEFPETMMECIRKPV
ncbi:unnamed protein product, partial [Nesidiocoris tenuis]